MALDQTMSILVVDDSAVIIRVVHKLLRHLGFTDIDEASDGVAALARMRTKHYGLVISDWKMKSSSCHDFLREVRGDPDLTRTPFIMMTGEYKNVDVNAAKRAGANNYIVKPFDAPTLKAKIESIFAMVDRSPSLAKQAPKRPKPGGI